MDQLLEMVEEVRYLAQVLVVVAVQEVVGVEVQIEGVHLEVEQEVWVVVGQDQLHLVEVAQVGEEEVRVGD